MAPAARSWTRYDGGIRELTVKELKAECKLRGLLKHSILNKAELISLLEGMRAIRTHVPECIYKSICHVWVDRPLLRDSTTFCIEKGSVEFSPCSITYIYSSVWVLQPSREATLLT